MKDDGFLKMIHTELPPEAEPAIELRCREFINLDGGQNSFICTGNIEK